jgi:methylmalonyl-CoA mutase cobalamin-binding subunit
MSKILIGTVGSDVHSVANNLLENELLSSGFKVVNLGVSVPVGEWINKVNEENPILVLIGSMNGDLQPVMDLIRELSLLKFPLNQIMIGGNLKLGSEGIAITEILRAQGVLVLDENDLKFSKISEICINKISTSNHKIKIN